MSNWKKTSLICVYGIVQGVGFRPFVRRLAEEFHLNGEVSNVGSFVKIYIQGREHDQKNFVKNLKDRTPVRANIIRMEISECTCREFVDFEITDSRKEPGEYYISPDIAVCPVCQRELYDAGNRRYMHPFINCTDCGPRFTILKEMPYDRERTSMADFSMCSGCYQEYVSSDSRRYDAQPVCCNECGPEVYLIGKDICGKEAITKARRAVKEGKVIAVKGIGGFHLCCDAADEEAVRYLRMKKGRPEKPLAVMMRDGKTVERECVLTKEQKSILEGAEKPILILKRKENHLAHSVAKENPYLGVFLPYTPLHMLLFDYDDGIDIGTDYLVMTSGNISGTPICRTDREAAEELSYCDMILSHNRDILIQADDSVMDMYNGKPYMIRRSRGYVPLPVRISQPEIGKSDMQLIAVGADLKNTFCLAKSDNFYLSPYIGDMAGRKTVEVWKSNVEHMKELLKIEPVYVACDLHPQYNTTIVARETGMHLIPIQHHYAHIVSCMAENDYFDDVIGAAFDGTGYGDDGTIWGGEFLRISRGSYSRIGSIMPFWQARGDHAYKEGWRMAVSIINSLYGTDAEEVIKDLRLCSEETRKVLWQMNKRRVNTIKSTSAGRLFDAVSAILGICVSASYEGEAAVKLQFAAEHYLETHPETEIDEIELLEEAENHFFYLATGQLIKYITEKRRCGESPEKLAYLFHLLLGKQMIKGCQYAANRTGIQCCALSGGVFQNKLLLGICEKGLRKLGFTVLTHSIIPPNDGGIALGQAVAAMLYLKREDYEYRDGKGNNNDL